MKYVFDASVAVKWLLGEPDFEKADRLILNGRSGTDELLVPDFFLAECGHAFFRAERKGNIAMGEAAQLLLALMPDLPALHDSTPLVPRAAAICQHLRKGFYDCLYMALAEREGAMLVTADEKLVSAAHLDYPYVVNLTSLP